MSAIHLIWDKQNQNGEALINKMLGACEHMGNQPLSYQQIPLSIGTIYLAVNNLLIGELEKATLQPLSDKESTCFAAMEGDLFNYHDIKNNLMDSGVHFSSLSDAEVWMEWCKNDEFEAFSNLNGDFVGFFVDKSVDKLIIVDNSKSGRSVYHYEDKNYLVLSSAFQAISATALPVKSIDNLVVSQILAQGFASGNQTLFKNIQKLTSLKVYKYDCGDLSDNLSTIVGKSVDKVSQGENITNLDALEEALVDALFMETTAEKNIGLLFTGGQISTSLATAGRVGGVRAALTYSLANAPKEGDKRYGDFRFAEDTSYEEGLALYQEVLSDKSLELWDEFIQKMESPVLTASAFVHFVLSKFVGERSHILLSGFGADALALSDLKTYAYYQYIKYYDSLKPWIPMLKKMKGLLPEKSMLPVKKHLDLLNILGQHIDEDPKEVKRKLFSILEEFTEGTAAMPLEEMKYENCFEKVGDHLNAEVRQIFRANQQQVRMPFLNDLVVGQFVNSSVEDLLENGRNAHLKAMLRAWGKETVASRPKYQTKLPWISWLKAGGAIPVKTQLARRESAIYEFVDFEQTQQYLDEALQGKSDQHERLWAIAVMGAWLDKHGAIA